MSSDRKNHAQDLLGGYWFNFLMIAMCLGLTMMQCSDNPMLYVPDSQFFDSLTLG